jgi:hypothetical protein
MNPENERFHPGCISCLPGTSIRTSVAWPNLRKKDRKRGEMSSEPSREEIDAKFWEVYPRSSARILQEVKQGMIVGFTELGSYPPGGYQELVDTPEEFLAREYGRKKIKVNFYYGDNFVCTINFKVGGWASHDDD